MSRVLTPMLLLLVGWTGCERKPDPPPQIVRQYVPVPRELTQRCAWPRQHKNSEVFESNAARKKCLLQYEGQLEAIESLKP